MTTVLEIAHNTVMKKIMRLSDSIVKPPIPMNREAFELDELKTHITKKTNECWIAYAFCNETKKVIDYVTGKRTKRTLKMIVDNFLLSNVKIIKTDKLSTYRSLIPDSKHTSNVHGINCIERNNLNLRTHLKRLSRRSICFSRSKEMLDACLKIYFWGMNYTYYCCFL